MSLSIGDVPLARPAVGLSPQARTRTVDRLARVLTILALAMAAILAAGAFGLALYGYSHDGEIYEGVRVAGVDVGGQTPDEAAPAIVARFDAYADTPISVESAGQTFLITPREAGAVLDLDATLDRAYAYGRTGSFMDRSARWARGLLTGASVAPVVRIDAEALDASVREIGAAVDRAPIDAYVAMDGEQPELVPDVPGIAVDREAARALLAGRFVRLDTAPLAAGSGGALAAVPADRLAAALPGAQGAVAAPLVLSSVEGSWSLSPEELREIVAVNDEGRVVVNRSRIEAFVQSVATAIDRPSRDADVRLNDDLSLSVVPGTYSVTVDVDATTEAAVAALLEGTHAVSVTLERHPPAITDADASAAIAEAEALIAAGIELSWSGLVNDGTARLGRDDLVQALIIEPRPGADKKFSIVLDPWLMAEVMTPIRDRIDVPAVDATFRLIDGEIKVVSASSDGQALDAQEAAEAVVAAVIAGEPRIELPVEDQKPAWTVADRGKIVLPDLLGDASTYYGNSSEPRRQNVERAVALEHGWLVPPGGVFSYVEHLGRVDETNGFTTGFGIVADEDRGGVTTAPVVGGGICQVSTTVFQAAFWAGLKIEERWQHPYWLSGYGQPPRGMKGLDAMVNVEDDWALDMKFRNTTDNWIAVVLIADGENVTAQILGTDPGWEVQVEGPILTNVVPKDDKIYYTESPELPAGQEMQVETAGEGFDAEIRRTVLDDGEVVDEYVLTSSFAPARNTILRGTGGARGDD